MDERQKPIVTRTSDNHEDTYNLYTRRGTGGPEDELKRSMRLAVYHTPDTQKTLLADEPRRYNFDSEHRWPIQQASHDLHDAEEAGTPKLFGYGGKPSQPSVSLFYGTKSARVYGPSLVGLAQKDSFERHGSRGMLQASEDRSQFSEAFVQHIQKVTGMKQTERRYTNDMTFESEEDVMSYGPVGEFSESVEKGWYGRNQRIVSDEEFGQGRNLMRSMLRQGRPSRSVGEQGTLF
jgi:hypothetical protein